MRTNGIHQSPTFGMSWHKSYFFSVEGFKNSKIISPTCGKILDKKTKDVVAIFTQLSEAKLDCTVFKKNWFNEHFPKVRYFFSTFTDNNTYHHHGFAYGEKPVEVLESAKIDLNKKLAGVSN